MTAQHPKHSAVSAMVTATPEYKTATQSHVFAARSDSICPLSKNADNANIIGIAASVIHALRRKMPTAPLRPRKTALAAA